MTRLEKCINNSHALYQEVFRRKGVEFTRNDRIWYSLERTPPLYSNLVTRSSDWIPDDNCYAIEARAESEQWSEWSIKDSFNVLDLTPYGFEKLFDAEWIYLEGRNFEPKTDDVRLHCRSVENFEEFENWLRVWDANEDLGASIFDFESVNDMTFVAAYEEDRITAGMIANPSDDVLGISNFFAPEPYAPYLSQMIESLYMSSNRPYLVGYAREIRPWKEIGLNRKGR